MNYSPLSFCFYLLVFFVGYFWLVLFFFLLFVLGFFFGLQLIFLLFQLSRAVICLSCQLFCIWVWGWLLSPIIALPGAETSFPDCVAGSQPNVLALGGQSRRVLERFTNAVGGRRYNSTKLLSNNTAWKGPLGLSWRDGVMVCCCLEN